MTTPTAQQVAPLPPEIAEIERRHDLYNRCAGLMPERGRYIADLQDVHEDRATLLRFIREQLASASLNFPCGNKSCNEDRERKMVSVPADPDRKPVFCDPCIAPIVSALNAAGLRTIASCCGHGRRPARISLEVGAEIFVVANFEEASKLAAMLPGDINDERPTPSSG